VFAAAALMEWVGFSIEIGGFLAGLALANSVERFHIESRIRPLRDFFIVVFFVVLGSSMVFSHFNGLLLPIIVFSLFVLIGNPLIVLVIMGLLGYRKRTGFLTGVMIAQISEFSFVLAALGLRLGHIPEGVATLITAVGVVTITLSTYLIMYADEIFRRLSPLLGVFQRKITREADVTHGFPKPIVLVGCHRTGQSIAFSLPKDDVLVVDSDPVVIQDLRRHGFDYVFGDIADPDVVDRADIGHAKLVISTSPCVQDNLALLSYIHSLPSHKSPRVVVRAEDERDARLLYDKGADYVLLPHFTSGQYLGKTIALDPELRIFSQLKERDLALLRRVGLAV
jgi:voltage-gated potassium channel Kch